MAKIGYLVACQGVETGPSQETVIVNPYVALTPLQVPGNYSFTLAFSLYDISPEEEYPMQIMLKDPNQQVILQQEFKFKFDAPPGSQSKRPYGDMNINFPNFEFRLVGEYTMSVSIGTDSTKDLSIEVHPRSEG